MPQWLLDRLYKRNDQPDAFYAFEGSVNWIKALSVIVNSDQFTDEKINDVYKKVSRRNNQDADTRVFENMLMAYHNLASLNSFNTDVVNKYDVVRSAMISWYYATYFAAKAMVAAASGANPETHTKTAKMWHSDFAEKRLLAYPFDLYLSTLIKKDVELEIERLRDGNEYILKSNIINIDEAKGACISALNGTANFEREKRRDRIINSKEFKALNLKNADFKTKLARELRDQELGKHQVNYLFQAIRHRGKANYRDSIFLSYGSKHDVKTNNFISDLTEVTEAFIRMASIYCQKRVVKGNWELFINDLEENALFSFPIKPVNR